MERLVRQLRDLQTYQRAMIEVRAVFELCATLPPSKQWRIADQLLRASRAVPALIAEAWARRHYTKAFRGKLSQALAESMEVQVWLECAEQCGYISSEEFVQRDLAWQQIGGMIRRMMQKAERFSGARK